MEGMDDFWRPPHMNLFGLSCITLLRKRPSRPSQQTSKYWLPQWPTIQVVVSKVTVGLWLNPGKLFSSTNEVALKRQSRQKGSCNLENFGQNIKIKNIKFKAVCFTPQSLSDRTDLVHLTLSSLPWQFHHPMSQVAAGTYCNVSTSVLEPFCSDDSTKTKRCQNPPLWGLQQQGVAGFAVQCFSDSCRICHLRVCEISAKQVNMSTISLSKQLETWTAWTIWHIWQLCEPFLLAARNQRNWLEIGWQCNKDSLKHKTVPAVHQQVIANNLDLITYCCIKPSQGNGVSSCSDLTTLLNLSFVRLTFNFLWISTSNHHLVSLLKSFGRITHAILYSIPRKRWKESTIVNTLKSLKQDTKSFQALHLQEVTIDMRIWMIYDDINSERSSDM